jgi:mannose-6-phosphate isomerase-like protein (cupin superfamily)
MATTIKVAEKKVQRELVKVVKVLKDKEGRELKITNALAGRATWLGPPLGTHRMFFIAMDPSIGTKHCLMALMVIPPGNETSLHAHMHEEAYYVIKGRGIMYTDTGEEFEVKEGYATFQSPGVLHAMRNTGLEDLVVLYIWAGPTVPTWEEAMKGVIKTGQEKHDFEVHL